jgi:hypothetical protein
MSKLIKVRLIEDGETVKEVEKDYEVWSEIQFVQVGPKCYAFSSSLSNPYLIAFYCQTDSRTVKFDSLDEV